MTERFTVEVDITAKDKTSNALNGVKAGFKEAFSEVITGAMRRAGESALDFAKQLPAMVVDLGKLGVQVQTAERRFTQFAGSEERAAEMLEAFNLGTDNTVDKMSAMGSAAKLLQMGLVENGSEMEQVAAMATRLGDQTQDAGSRIADFAALLANQSIPRLDNFGISSGEVRRRIDELLKSGQALSREQAFKMAVMEQGAKALDTLGDTADLTSTQIGAFTASLETMRQEFGKIVAEDFAGSLEALSREGKDASDIMRDLPTRFREWREELSKTTFAHRASNEEIRKAREEHAREIELKRQAAETEHRMAVDLVTGRESREQYNRAIEETIAAMDEATIAAATYYQRQELLAITTENESTRAFEQYSRALLDTEKAQDRAYAASLELEEQLRREAEAAMETAETHLGMAMQYTDAEEDREKTAQDFAERREDLEREHQENLVEIAKKGQSWRTEVDEEELRLETRIAQGRLEQLLERQAEFNEETTDLERAQMERSILNLQEEITEKTSLLEQAHEGYITMKGQNVDALIAEENRQYQESLVNLEEAQMQQEEAQRQSLGRMVLQHFNAWVEMNLAADGFTQEEAAFITRMRNQIGEEYGLITDTAITEMQEQEAEWKRTMAVMTGEAESFFDFFMEEFNKLPSEKVIRIRTELATATTAEEGRRGGETMQHGTMFAPGGMALVGERGPELAYIPRGAQVFPTDQSRHITENFNLTVNSHATSMGIQNEFYLMQGLAGR